MQRMGNAQKLRRTAMVTGVRGGIGKALVGALQDQGFRVIGMDRHSTRDVPLGGDYLEVDLHTFVSSQPYRQSRVADLQARIPDGRLDVLVNNAAVQILGGVETLSISDWHCTLNVNVLAPFLLSQALLPQLEAARGCVINISSIHALLTKPDFVAYATSKAALSGLTRAMAVDLGNRVRVNAIEPAAIATEMLKAGFAERTEELVRLEACHPQGRIGTPEEVAALAVSIASGDLRFLHGACIGMHGGIGARLHDPA